MIEMHDDEEQQVKVSQYHVIQSIYYSPWSVVSSAARILNDCTGENFFNKEANDVAASSYLSAVSEESPLVTFLRC